MQARRRSGEGTPVDRATDRRPGGSRYGAPRRCQVQYTFFAVGFLREAVVVTGWLGPVGVVPRQGPIVVVPHVRTAVAVHDALVAGRATVVDTSTGEVLRHEPHTWLSSFSPDGRLLVGSRGRDTVLLDARTGALRSTLAGRLQDLTWEDDRHLLAVAYRGARQAMVRIGLDGHAELVGPVVPEEGFRYTFQTQP